MVLISPETLPRMSVVEYLAYEHSQETRHELVDGYLYPWVELVKDTGRSQAIFSPLCQFIYEDHSAELIKAI